MEKYLASCKSVPENPKQRILRNRWSRSLIELNGKFAPKDRHDLSSLLVQSYYQIGDFLHLYHVNGTPCISHILTGAIRDRPRLSGKKGISGLDFDTKGSYLASVTRSGCLTVHDFDNLYYHCNESLPGQGLEEDESKHRLHLSLHEQLDAVRWNPAKEDEVACVSTKTNEVRIFDIGYISSEPVEVLRTRSDFTILGYEVQKGLSDIAFTAIDESRLIASDTHGKLNVWDRRTSVLPCLELSADCRNILNSIQIHAENQLIFAAGMHANIYMWDVRGGRTSAPFQGHSEERHPPLTSLDLMEMLEKIGNLKAQSNIVPQEIYSIDLDPSCSYQLAFHLDHGWSGVLDLYNFQVTHFHCPPPAWLNDSTNSADLLHLTKPSWLATNSIYVVGSLSRYGIHLLDFHPGVSSPCHVDYNEDIQSLSERKKYKKKNRFVPLKEGVTACVTHPRNNTIVAGTKCSRLLVLSQKHLSTSGSES